MEDGWLLAQMLEYHFAADTHDRKCTLSAALELFDQTRSPYYREMYDVLDAKPKKGEPVDYAAWSPTPGGKLNWIYFHDVEDEWKSIERRLQREKKKF